VQQQLLAGPQFAHEKMLHWDPPSRTRQDVSPADNAAVIGFCGVPASCWSTGIPSSSAAAPLIC